MLYSIIGLLGAMVAGGLARSSVGAGKISRWYIYPPVCLMAAAVGFGVSYWTLIIALSTALTMGLGYTKWMNGPYMTARYAVLPAMAAIAAILFGVASEAYLIWPALCAIIGLQYYDLMELAKTKGWSHKRVEFIAGAIIIGSSAANALLLHLLVL